MVSELKPCPFCGSNRIAFRSTPDMDTDGKFHRISCNECGAGSREKFAMETCPLFYEELRNAWNTRPAPAATDTVSKDDYKSDGLVTVSPKDYDFYEDGELVTRSQAEELLAAEREAQQRLLDIIEEANDDKEALEADNAALIHDLNRIKDHETELVNDNAEKDARIKELETELENGGRVKGVNTQYANALAYLEMTEDDDPEEFAKRTWDERKALEAKLATAQKALEPFAKIPVSTVPEGRLGHVPDKHPYMVDLDGNVLFTASDIRKARAVLEGEPS